MIHPIVTHPDPILHQSSAPVPHVTDATRALLDDMLETMYDAQGRGLAAVQIAVLQRVVVVDTAWKDGARTPLFFVKPEVVWSSDVLATREERCLSIPDTPTKVLRPDRVRVRFLDRASGSAAVVRLKPEREPTSFQARSSTASITCETRDERESLALAVRSEGPTLACLCAIAHECLVEGLSPRRSSYQRGGLRRHRGYPARSYWLQRL